MIEKLHTCSNSLVAGLFSLTFALIKLKTKYKKETDLSIFYEINDCIIDNLGNQSYLNTVRKFFIKTIIEVLIAK